MARGDDCCLASNGGVHDINWYPWHLWFAAGLIYSDSCRSPSVVSIAQIGEITPARCQLCERPRRPNRLGHSQPSNYSWLDKSTINLDGVSFLEPKSGAWLGPLLDQNLSLVLRWREVRVDLTRRYSARLGPGRLAMFHHETAESPTSRMQSLYKQGIDIFEQDSRPSGITAWCTKLQ